MKIGKRMREALLISHIKPWYLILTVLIIEMCIRDSSSSTSHIILGLMMLVLNKLEITFCVSLAFELYPIMGYEINSSIQTSSFTDKGCSGAVIRIKS